MKFKLGYGCMFATGIVAGFIQCSSNGSENPRQLLTEELSDYTSTLDAHIGVAVIFENGDTVSINGDESFPMLSVYKFPQALNVAEYCERNGLSPEDTVNIKAEEIRPSTWSPLREEYGMQDIRLTIKDLLAFSLQRSDNNACDILFRLTGGPAETDRMLKQRGYSMINVVSTENEMHEDTSLCRKNDCTPKQMASLINDFYLNLRNSSKTHLLISQLMETCTTGTDRLALPVKLSGGICGHKTGTGDLTPSGRIMAINDAGYIIAPNDRHYTIAVLIEDSKYSADLTASIIAHISSAIYNHVVSDEQS